MTSTLKENVMNFRIQGISSQPFQSLFTLSDAELAAIGAKRCFAVEPYAAPCRVSMVDAQVGEELILTTFEHQPANSPYRASGPIYIRREAAEAFAADNTVPDCVRRRLLSLRAYDVNDMIVDAEVANGSELETAIGRFFADPAIAYLHVHYARRGCYACRIDRA
jgi:hypothetical protein